MFCNKTPPSEGWLDSQPFSLTGSVAINLHVWFGSYLNRQYIIHVRMCIFQNRTTRLSHFLTLFGEKKKWQCFKCMYYIPKTDLYSINYLTV